MWSWWCRHKYEARAVSHMAQMHLGVKVRDYTVVTLVCVHCGNMKQEELEGHIPAENLLPQQGAL